MEESGRFPRFVTCAFAKGTLGLFLAKKNIWINTSSKRFLFAVAHWGKSRISSSSDPLEKYSHLQSTSCITTLGGASKRCPYSRSVVIPEVSFYGLQWDGTLLWAWKVCRYSRIVVISAVVIRELSLYPQSLFANCRYIRSRYSRIVVISAVVIRELSLYPQSLFANCRYIRSRYSRIVVISAVVIRELSLYPQSLFANCRYIRSRYSRS